MKRHYVGTVNASNFQTPQHYISHSSGYTRLTLVDHTVDTASVHMELALAQFEPGGHLDPVAHAFEKGFYVLDGASPPKSMAVACGSQKITTVSSL